eukprot:11178604-Lingulodinium_polyedra.AAC.1
MVGPIMDSVVEYRVGSTVGSSVPQWASQQTRFHVGNHSTRSHSRSHGELTRTSLYLDSEIFA